MKKDKLNILNLLKIELNQRFNNQIHQIILFGSRANSSDKEDSDYDILIILNQITNKKQEGEICYFIYNFEIDNNVFIDMHFLHKDEISKSLRAVQPVFSNAITKGIYL